MVVKTCSDEVLGCSGTTYTFSGSAKNAFKEYFDTKAQECQHFANEKKCYKVSNSSKSIDFTKSLRKVIELDQMGVKKGSLSA